jgi:hypothetical protein
MDKLSPPGRSVVRTAIFIAMAVLLLVAVASHPRVPTLRSQQWEPVYWRSANSQVALFYRARGNEIEEPQEGNQVSRRLAESALEQYRFALEAEPAGVPTRASVAILQDYLGQSEAARRTIADWPGRGSSRSSSRTPGSCTGCSRSRRAGFGRRPRRSSGNFSAAEIQQPSALSLAHAQHDVVEPDTERLELTDIEIGGSWQVAPYAFISAGWFFQCWWDLGQSEGVIGTNYGPLDTSNILGFDGLFVRAEMLF